MPLDNPLDTDQSVSSYPSVNIHDMFDLESVDKPVPSTVVDNVVDTVDPEFSSMFDLNPVETPEWVNDIDTPPREAPFMDKLQTWGKNIWNEIKHGTADIVEGMAADIETTPDVQFDPSKRSLLDSIRASLPKTLFQLPETPLGRIYLANEARKRGAVTSDDYNRLGTEIAQEQLGNIAQTVRRISPAYDDKQRDPGFQSGLLGVAEKLTTMLARTSVGMGLSAATPAVGVPALFYQFKGEKYKEYTDKGMDKDRADLLSDTYGLVNGGLEFLGNMILVGGTQKVITGVMAKTGIGRRLQNIILGLAESGIGEGIEEFTQQYGEAMVDTIADHPDASDPEIILAILSRWSDPELFKDAGISAGWGALGGLFLAGVSTGVMSPKIYKNYKEERDASNIIAQAYRKAAISDDEINAILEAAPADHIIHKAINKVRKERAATIDPNNVGDISFEDFETNTDGEPITTPLATKPEYGQSIEGIGKTETGVVPPPLPSRTPTGTTWTETQPANVKFAGYHEYMAGQAVPMYETSDGSTVSTQALREANIPVPETPTMEEWRKQQATLTHYSPITDLAELEGSPLKGTEQHHSKRDVRTRKDQSTKEYPYVPFNYFYGPGAKPEPSIVSIAESVYEAELKPDEIYPGAKDPYKLADRTVDILNNSTEPLPNAINVFAKLVKDAGFKGFSYAAGSNLNEKWYVLFDKVPVKERAINSKDMPRQTFLQAKKVPQFLLKKAANIKKALKTKKVEPEAGMRELKKVSKEITGIKRDIRNIERIRDAISKGHLQEWTDEYTQAVKKYGSYLDGHTIKHTAGFKVGSKTIYGIPKGLKISEKKITLQHPLHGAKEVTVKYASLPDSDTIEGKSKDSMMIIAGPIFSADQQTRNKEIDDLVRKYSWATDWYQEWNDWMHSFVTDEDSKKLIQKHIKIQAVLSAQQTPQSNQLIYKKVIDALENDRSLKDVGLSADQLKKVNEIWQGKDTYVKTLEDRIERYGSKVGAYMHLGLFPRDERAVVLDRHMPRAWGYNIMWNVNADWRSTRFTITPAVRKEIVDDILAAAKRNNMTPGAVQAALWFAIRPESATVDRYSEAAKISADYIPDTFIEKNRPHKSYKQAVKQVGSSMNNLYVRRENAPEGNNGRVLMIQISNSLLNPKKAERTAESTYYDMLYTKRDGYVRPDDFWELPEWQAMVAGRFPDSDLYVVRNINQAKKFLAESGYSAILFSTQDVSRKYQHELAEAFPGNVVLGGYADKTYFKDLANAKWYDSIEDAAEDILGNAAGDTSSDYSLYKDTETIPRLCMSQGCLHKCAFCSVPKDLTVTAAEAIAAQVAAFKDLKFKLVYLNDKTFGQAKNYKDLIDINQQIKKYNKDFQGFIIQTTAAQMKHMTGQFMHDAGIKYVELGVESFNDMILQKVHKPATTKLIQEAVDKLRRYNIAFIPNVLVGLMGKGWSETRGSYQNTLNFLRDNSDIISHVNLYNLALYTGTELADEIEDKTDIDFDENVVEKSYHKDPELHKWFNTEALRYAITQLSKTPKAIPKQKSFLQVQQDTKDTKIPKEISQSTIIPPIENTLDALALAETATPEQLAEVKRLRAEYIAKASSAKAAKNLDDMMRWSFKAQFMREVLEAKEDPDRIKRQRAEFTKAFLQVRAYHGTPFDFDSFNLSKIGTGEGAQAFGWGFYFTGNQNIATQYARSLSQYGGGNPFTKPAHYVTVGNLSVKGLPIITNGYLPLPLDHVLSYLSGEIAYNITKVIKKTGNIDVTGSTVLSIVQKYLGEYRDRLRSRVKQLESSYPDPLGALSFLFGGVDFDIKGALNELKPGKWKAKPTLDKLNQIESYYPETVDDITYTPADSKQSARGIVYTVDLGKDIPEDKLKWLDWYDNISPKDLNTIIKGLKNSYITSKIPDFKKPLTVKTVYNALKQLFGSSREASLFLYGLGITGIRYPTGTLSGKSKYNRKEFNYVVFYPDTTVTIEDKTFLQVRAYHGGPHAFDRFTTDQMGSGEGVQAFGWGLYFTDERDIAEHYAEATPYQQINPLELYNQADEDLKDQLDEAAYTLTGLKFSSLTPFQQKPVIRYAVEDLGAELPSGKRGNVYTVTLHKGKNPTEYIWLDWTKPARISLSSRIPALLSTINEKHVDIRSWPDWKDALRQSAQTETGQSFYRLLTSILSQPFEETSLAVPIAERLTRNKRRASLALLRAGIDGIRYPAGLISGITDSKATNYVVFDENAVTIDKRTFLQAQAAKEVDGLYDLSKDVKFKKWFKGSKVVDSQKQPMILYHGSTANFDTFKGIRATGFFSESVKVAGEFSNEPGGSIYPVYMKSKNPLDLTGIKLPGSGSLDATTRLSVPEFMKVLKSVGITDIAEEDLTAGLGEDTSVPTYVWEYFDKDITPVLQTIWDAGYDSVKLFEKGSTAWIIKDPAQVKSIFNRGTWDATDPRILFQVDKAPRTSGTSRTSRTSSAAPMSYRQILSDAGIAVMDSPEPIHDSAVKAVQHAHEIVITSLREMGIAESVLDRINFKYSKFIDLSKLPGKKQAIENHIRSAEGIKVESYHDVLAATIFLGDQQAIMRFALGLLTPGSLPASAYHEGWHIIEELGLIDPELLERFKALMPEVEDRANAAMAYMKNNKSATAMKQPNWLRQVFEAIKRILLNIAERIRGTKRIESYDEIISTTIRKLQRDTARARFPVMTEKTLLQAQGDIDSRYYHNPWYYSKAVRIVTKSDINTIPKKAASVINWLAKKQVKPEEIKWLNLESWLKDNKDAAGNIDREALIKYIVANQMTLEEVIYDTHPVQVTANIQYIQNHMRRRFYRFKVGSMDILIKPVAWNPSNIDDDGDLYEVEINGITETYPDPLDYLTDIDSDLKKFVEDELDLEYEEADWHGYIMQSLRAAPMEHIIEHRWNGYIDLEGYDRIDFKIIERQGTYDLFYGTGYSRGQTMWEHYTNAPTLDEVKQFIEDRAFELENQIELETQSDDNTQYSEWTLPGGEDYTEVLITIPEDITTGKYRSSHWSGVLNPIAHVRFKTRLTAEGELVGFIEEIQSDWHQRGAWQGYIPRMEDSPQLTEFYRKYIEEGQNAGVAEMQQLAADLNLQSVPEISDMRDFLEESAEPSTLAPDAPFRTTWQELVVKRMLQHFAEKGCAYMAWTTGKQQADRYNLRQYIVGLEFYTNSYHSIGLLKYTSLNNDKRSVVVDMRDPGKLAEYIGNELAQKLLEQPTTNWDSETVEEGVSVNRVQTLSGIELEVGGEGRKRLYDEIIPSYISKYVKQWGVQIVDISLPEIQTRGKFAEYAGPDYTLDELIDKLRFANEIGESIAVTTPLELMIHDMRYQGMSFITAIRRHGSITLSNYLGGEISYPRTSPFVKAVTITPAMRDSVLYQGQTLFQARAADPANPLSLAEIQDLQLKLTLETGGSTISQSGVNMYGKPYIAIGVLKTREKLIKGRDLTLKDLQDYWTENKSILEAHPDLTVGTWIDRETGNTNIDLSITLPKVFEPQLVTLGRKLGQKAVYDLESGVEIYIRNPSSKVPDAEEQLRLLQRVIRIVSTGDEPPKVAPPDMPVGTSAKQVTINQTRELLGLDELDSQEKRTWSNALSAARERNYHNTALDIASAVIVNPEALSDIETAGMVIAAAKLRNEHDQVIAQLATEVNPVIMRSLSTRINRIEDQFDTITTALYLSGTEKGRALAAQKLTINQNYDLISVLNRAKSAKGSELTPSERSKLDQLTNQLKTARTNIDTLQAQIDRLQARQEISNATSSGLSGFQNMSEAKKDAALVKKVQEYKANPTAEALADIAFNIGSRPGVQYIDTIVSRIAKYLPGIQRSTVTGAIQSVARRRRARTNSILSQLNAIRKEAREDKALRGKINDLEYLLTSRSVPVSQPKIKSAVSDVIQQLRERRDQLKKDLSKSDAVKRDRINKVIRELERKIATGNILPAPKVDVPKSKELQTLEYKRDKLRQDIRRAINDMKPKSFLDYAVEPFNLIRALITSLDLSAVLRQGGIIALARPVTASKSIIPMLKAAISEEAAYRINNEIPNRDNGLLYRKTKLYIAPIDNTVKLSQREEAFMSRLAAKIPFVRASERAYVTFLNKLRADVFDILIANLSVNGEPTLDEAQAIANYINAATGRGNLKSLEQNAVLLNTVFFAPKYVISRFQFLLGQPLYGGTANTRKLIAKEYGRYLLGVAVVLALGALAGGDIERDPRSPDFGKIRFGNTRIDPLSGLVQVTVLLSRVFSGSTKSSTTGRVTAIRGEDVPYAGSDTSDVIFRFLRTKLSPLFGTALDIAAGENVIGEPVTTGSLITNAIIPMSIRDIYEMMRTDLNLPTAWVLAILSIFGMSLQTYNTKQNKNSREKRKTRRSAD